MASHYTTKIYETSKEEYVQEFLRKPIKMLEGLNEEYNIISKRESHSLSFPLYMGKFMKKMISNAQHKIERYIESKKESIYAYVDNERDKLRREIEEKDIIYRMLNDLYLETGDEMLRDYRELYFLQRIQNKINIKINLKSSDKRKINILSEIISLSIKDPFNVNYENLKTSFYYHYTTYDTTPHSDSTTEAILITKTPKKKMPTGTDHEYPSQKHKFRNPKFIYQALLNNNEIRTAIGLEKDENKIKLFVDELKNVCKYGVPPIEVLYKRVSTLIELYKNHFPEIRDKNPDSLVEIYKIIRDNIEISDHKRKSEVKERYKNEDAIIRAIAKILVYSDEFTTKMFKRFSSKYEKVPLLIPNTLIARYLKEFTSSSK